jgi:hypothetical protein
MKPIHKYIRNIALITLLMISFYHSALAQGTDSRQKFTKEEKIFAGIVIIPQTTNISNRNFESVVPLQQKNGISVNFVIEGGYYFSKMAGVSIGAGMSSYSAEQILDSCSIKYNAIDSDLESFEMRIKGKTITETQKLSFLNIPVCFILKIPAGEKLGFYIKAGMSFDIPMTKTWEGNGTFTYDGYYATYPVLLHDIPGYFPANLNTSSEGTLEVKSFSQTIIASGGAFARLNESIHFSLGINFNRSLGNISAYNPESYKLTSEPGNLNSIMGGVENAGVTGLGLSLGVRYYIR